MTTRNVVYVDTVGGPLFEEMTEDGPIETYRVYVCVAEDWGQGAPKWTHKACFIPQQRHLAVKLAERVEAAGQIDTQHWVEGTPWDYVRDELRAADELLAMGANEQDLERAGLA